jgi:c-di-GMP phosphodiesterase
MKVARVKVRGKKDLVLVPITSPEKPSITKDIEEKWQIIVDLMAKILDVPSGLIMRLDESSIEIFMKNRQKENPYHEHEKADLSTGLYCETVVGQRNPLLVPDAREDPDWEDNPDVELNMISYLGFPIIWPDGEVFGTLCVLDKKKNKYSDLYIDLLSQFKEVLEQDLKILQERDDFKKQNLKKELLLREVHHRVKNNFNILISFLRLKSRKKSDVTEILKDIELKIKTFSMVHDKIFRGGDYTKLKLSDYVEELTRSIISSHEPSKVGLDVRVDDFMIDLTRVIPLGMLLNELMVNSLKHAFDIQPNPKIIIEIKKKEKNKLNMKYQDNGKGFQKGFSPDQTDTIGFQLIRSLTKEMDGDFSVVSKGGVKYDFSFELPVKKT